MSDITPAHEQAITHRYSMAYPEHGPRESDPAYADFHAFKGNRKKAGTWYCDFAQEFRAGDTSECDLTKPLEAHHKHIEWAMLNEVDLTLLEAAYPGVSAMGVGAWVESAENLELLCVWHHRSHAGKHTAAYADFEAQKDIRRLIT
jgi:hypothetical protein